MKIGNMLKNKTNKSKLTIGRLRKRVEKLEQEKMNTYEKFLLGAAELDNYKKRSAREQLSFKKFANQELLQEILTIVDILENAIKYSINDSESIIKGIELTLKEMEKILKKFNVEPINAVMRPFDPRFHKSLLKEENDNYPENTILHEAQKGYMLHDRLLRPSTVFVSTLKTKEI